MRIYKPQDINPASRAVAGRRAIKGPAFVPYKQIMLKSAARRASKP